jgi:hypothetical protein
VETAPYRVLARLGDRNVVDFEGLAAHISIMSIRAKQAATTRRSTSAAERPVVYHGIKIAPIAGRRSPVALAIRDALRAKSESAGGDSTHG